MRCPTLTDLPPPPEGKTGWPWTRETPRVPESMPDGKPWPRISIVTPSYNQGQFIEETIRSVLLQGYPDLEYIIMDGGSTDESVEIIRKYERWITFWVSEPDGGQADAIRTGFDMANGDIIAWLNSDDIYLHKTLQKVAESYQRYLQGEWWIGNTFTIDSQNQVLNRWYARSLNSQGLLYTGMPAAQPSTFWKREAYVKLGGLDANMQFSFDYDLNLRFAQRTSPIVIDSFLSAFRSHPASKTINIMDVRHEEDRLIRKRYGKYDCSRWYSTIITVYYKVPFYLWHKSRLLLEEKVLELLP